MSFSRKNKYGTILVNMKRQIFFRRYRVKFLFTVIAITTFLTGGCKEEEKIEPSDDTINLEVYQTDENDFSGIQNWHITNKRIAVLFGYDFNTPEIVESYKEILGERYGLEEDGGMIVTITYPDDFRHNGKMYPTDLKNFLSDSNRDYCAAVILGAPENTHISLARLQDEWNMSVPFPIAALFPQDDVLGLEATCDLVIDRMQTGDMAEESFSNDELFITQKAPQILCQLLDYLIELGTSLPKNSSVQANAMQMFRGEKIAHYLDPETGLQSVNHFILY